MPTGTGVGGGAGCAAAAPFTGARDGSTKDAVVSATASLLCITATAATPTNRPQASSAAAHEIAGRPATRRPPAVTAVPGPSAVLTALAVSGLPVDRFCFEGFLPRKAGDRARRLAEVADDRRTLVFFEAPHRTAATLGAMADAFGEDRRAAVCRELTKTHEEVRRGPLTELAAWAAEEVRGEVTIVVAGAPAPERVDDPAELVARVRALEDVGTSRKEAIVQVARSAGVPKRVVYDAVHKPVPPDPGLDRLDIVGDQP